MIGPHIRSDLDERLESIRFGLLAMSDLVTERIGLVTAALLERDLAQADNIIDADRDVDLLSQQVELQCIDALMREQPVASDLRAVVGAIHINADVERSGDLVANIAKASGFLGGSKPNDNVRDLILRMGDQAEVLFDQAREAFRFLDLDRAMEIDALDDVLDDLHQDFIEVVIHEARQGSLSPNETLQLAMIGRFFERIGDHAENIAEQIRYMIEGAAVTEDHLEPAPAIPSEVSPRPQRGLAVIDSIAEERRIDATRRDFVANVSHELKTPIAAIGLLAETLAGTDEDEVRQRLTEHLDREVRRAESIIDDLLELSRLEEGGTSFKPVEVSELVRSACDVVSGLARVNDIELVVVDLPPGLMLDADSRQVVRALVNLLDNAIRYSEPGSRVAIKVKQVQETVDIEVDDRGAGIPRAELERIFERFYRVDQARSRRTGGTGLGLSIVRHVADNHHGSVSVDSTLSEGSSFTLQLPIKQTI